MRLLLDEHLSPRIASVLQRNGFDVEAVAGRPDLRGRTDREILDAARAEGRAIVTADVADHMRLFGNRQRLGVDHPGLVLLASARWGTARRDVGLLVRSLATLLRREPGDHALEGRVTWLEQAE
jgi:hypothetical protein